MSNEERVKQILSELNNGKITITHEDIITINQLCARFLNETYTDYETIRNILEISNILYNNTTHDVLPLEDGVYDLVVVKYNNLTGDKAPVGAPPIHFEPDSEKANPELLENHDELIQPVVIIDSNSLYRKEIMANEIPIKEDFEYNLDNEEIPGVGDKVSHNYPELVGTLHKCKFVLTNDAENVGANTDLSVKIFERDFFYPTFNTAYQFAYQKNCNNPAVQFIAMLKYDGVSVEAEICGDTIVTATSRGDTANDEATDYTPIFGGYKFARAKGMEPKTFGMKFEAIITYENMYRLAELTGRTYKNPRVAVIGILGSKDARKYRDFITLVPLRTSGINFIDPIQEANFMNKYYSSGVNLKFALLSGQYYDLLWQVRKFTAEAEFMRPYMGFLYDGVVISYIDPDVRRVLGRRNSIDEWSMAIKFNPMSKQTHFYGYKYTVGQEGKITPMAYFAPVEFLGTVHDKTTVHSLKRFNQLALRKGDIVEITYVNDVICYLTKPEIEANASNKSPIIKFPEYCPSCGGEITVSDSGASAYCLNMNCPAKVITRTTNMLDKIGIKDFGRAYIERLGITNLTSLLKLDKKKVISEIGEVMGNKLFDRINEICTKEYPDYRVVGAIGFSSVGEARWKLILSKFSLEYIINSSRKELIGGLKAIKGIGQQMAETIANERQYFKEDLLTIASMTNIRRSFGTENLYKPAVRFTGIRSDSLVKAFNDKGFDADGNKSVTKSTAILIVPYVGYSSSKMNKISNKCMVMTEQQAWDYINTL